MSNEIYFVTGNEGKFLEVKYYIEKYEPNWTVKRFDADLFEHQTTDQKQVAIDKAKQAWQLLRKPVLVDDSAMYFDRYNNFPGVMTKFVFGGLGLEGILKLVEGDNRATFLLYLAYVDSDGEPHLFEGICKGKIVPPTENLAHPMLPWDDIFVVENLDKTYSQLRQTNEFEKYGSRLLALSKFVDWHKQNRR
jgi:non-canonical purine NTP pyrophosphatase (RdgB/HAM1 family)